VLRGAYLFFSPSVDVDKQLAALAAALDAEGGLQPGDLPVVLDVEVADSLPIDTVAARAKDWLTKAEARFKVRPIVYTSSGFATPMQGALAAWPLWIANYKVTCPNLPDGFTAFEFWQSGQAPVPGIAGDVDVDVWNGTRADLDKILVGATTDADAGAPPPAPVDAGPPPPPPCR
jgi:lysozyme